MGAGVVDNLRAMRLPCLVLGVNFGAGPGGFTAEECLNVRAEIWVLMRNWLQNGGCIPEYLPKVERTFPQELSSVGYGFASKVKGRSEAIQLTSKKDIKRETGWSPDFGDALALTFAVPSLSLPTREGAPTTARVLDDYNPLKGGSDAPPSYPATGPRFERWSAGLYRPASGTHSP